MVGVSASDSQAGAAMDSVEAGSSAGAGRCEFQVRPLQDEGGREREVASKKMKIFHFSLLTSSRSLVSC
jgi:hypothetical protein